MNKSLVVLYHMSDEGDNDYGHLDLERCEDGDNSNNYLESKNK